MAINKKELIREFAKAIRKKSAAVFAGAGLSRPSGYVDWKELLRPLAEDIHLNVDYEHDLLSVAQFYRNERGGRAGLNQKIVEEFTRHTEISENVRILTKPPITTYWTTNYDSLLEDGLRDAGRNPDVKHETEQMAVPMYDRDAVVYKMHGDASNPAHAVLTKDDYEMYGYRRPMFRTALKGDLISKTFLFVGFSFEDPNLDYILGQIHSLMEENIRDHYCFLRRACRKDYETEEQYGYARARQDYREKDLRRYGIQTCFVDSYDEITEILRRMEEAVLRKNIFISGSAVEYNGGWSERSAEELAGKLASVLVEKNYRITSGFGLGIGSAVINSALDVIYRSKYRHTDEYLCLKPFPQNIRDTEEKERRYTQYREEMLDDSGIAIFLFGNKSIIDPTYGSEKIVNSDGCREEFEIARKKRRIIIPVGSTGYMAAELLDLTRANAGEFPYLDGHFDILNQETNIDRLVAEITGIVEANQI